MVRDTVRRQIRRGIVMASCAALATPPLVGAQEAEPSLLKVEVGDSIGLPLPNATLEAFTFFEGGISREWAPIQPQSLPAGIFLLRFSHPGYRPAVLSVPLRTGSVVSLRVRLTPQRDTTPPRPGNASATQVQAIGLAIDGRARNDIMGMRRVIAGQDIAASADAHTVGALLRRVRNTDLKVLPGSSGSFRVFTRGRGGGYSCAPQVMINGDRRRFLPFAVFDGLYRPDGIEVLEIFPEGHVVPLGYQGQRSPCGLLVAWLKDG
ncbi:MAG TPA: carboxypeptidase-like regulatory domain-containing protein [Gemmatimonadaceae bacterium]|nr:carboxypeptidase-like regulatory domain-containing protein [Gemmatimonadaceae bacterium]